ncbi:ankyrin repeat and SAM domain-containing protein 6-like [Zingiber officinale]|uniref:SAM domain-containing protein n=1 Tax=Zingiber officinale TaxID=94328 RepID=A0A8J5GGK1_ZINOF|nr:ankyrin repeat and SAM domain-containing protein 6-like [Zingiber officinale]XP_042389041.1 ankyrin repeat and SAM domain-containing protein 6-like [Zingiber officinale]KAG6507167.1 hypothetical protein ZIOFF_032508 [Zingiber officinale]
MDDLPPPELPSNGGVAVAPPLEAPDAPMPGTKRQRRPSVRLGEIGDQPAAIPSEPHLRRSKHWNLSAHGDNAKPRVYHHPSAHRQPSKTRHLTTLAPRGDGASDALPPPPPPNLTDDGALLSVDENLDPLSAGVKRVSRDPKPWRGARRVRSSWASKEEEGVEGADFKTVGGEDAADDGLPEPTGSPSERNDRRTAGVRVRVSESRDVGTDALADAPSDTDGGDWFDRDGHWRSGEDGGVRSWLEGLGLGRYAPVFEIHEVDDEVLPLLTLDDLKDMGINAVGSRRKMFCSIQRLRKNMDS